LVRVLAVHDGTKFVGLTTCVRFDTGDLESLENS
jgi:hypothetical protein